MSRTWPEMFQRQVRVVVAERHTLARSSVSEKKKCIKIEKKMKIDKIRIEKIKTRNKHKQKK
jgi:hypothetical protein